MKKLCAMAEVALFRSLLLIIGLLHNTSAIVAMNANYAPTTNPSEAALCQMNMKLHLMQACKASWKTTTAYRAGGFSQSETMFSDIQEQLKDLVLRYANTPCQITKPDLWMLYNTCVEAVDADFQSFSMQESSPHKAPRRSLMALAQQMITLSAARNDYDLKLSTIFRDDGVAFRKLLTASYTLHIPFARALARAKGEGLSFALCLEKELHQGYWHDESFSSVMRYMKRYLIYEIYVAQRNSSLIQEYPALEKMSAEEVAHQMIANYIVLYLVQPYLVKSGVAMSNAKEFSEAEEVGISFETQGQSSQSFKFASSYWYKIVNHILNEKSSLHHRSGASADSDVRIDREEVRRRRDTVSISESADIEIDKATFELSTAFNVTERHDAATLSHIFSEYVAKARIRRALVVPTAPLVKKYAAAMTTLPIDDLSTTNGVYDQFLAIQEIIRAADHWHSGDHHRVFDKIYKGDIKPFLEAFDDGNWDEKVDILSRMSEMIGSVADENFAVVVKSLATVFAQYSAYLHDDALLALYQILFDLKLAKPFSDVDGFLEKIIPLSRESAAIAQMRKTLLPRMQLPKRQSIHISKKGRLERNYEFKYLDGISGKPATYTIEFPITKGIGQIANTFKQSPIFVGVDSDVLMLVARMAVPKRLKAGALLYREGEPSLSFALITDGEVIVSQGGRNNVHEILTTGQTVGDKSLYQDNSRHTSDVYAKERVELYEISTATFRDFMMKQPSIMRYMFDHLVKRVANGQKQLRESGLLTASLEESPLACSGHNGGWLISDISKSKRIKKGEQLLSRGSVFDLLIRVTKGDVSVMAGDRVVERVGARNYVDEISFLAREDCYPFSIYAGEKGCSYSVVSRDKFDGLIAQEPSILLAMAASLSQTIDTIYKRLMNKPAYALQIACEEDNLSMARKAYETDGVSLNTPCPLLRSAMDNSRPLHIAALNNSMAVFKYLLSVDADLNATDAQGNTAAHIAAREGHVDILSVLIIAFANVCLENTAGETPLSLANSQGHQAVVDLLNRYSCQTESSNSRNFF